MNPRLLITITVMLLSQSVLLAVSPLVTDDADTVEPGKLQLNCDFQFVRTSSTLLYLVTDQSGLGLDSSFGARRNIRLSGNSFLHSYGRVPLQWTSHVPLTRPWLLPIAYTSA